MSFSHIVRKKSHFVFGRGSVEQESENYPEMPFRVFDTEDSTVILFTAPGYCE